VRRVFGVRTHKKGEKWMKSFRMVFGLLVVLLFVFTVAVKAQEAEKAAEKKAEKADKAEAKDSAAVEKPGAPVPATDAAKDKAAAEKDMAAEKAAEKADKAEAKDSAAVEKPGAPVPAAEAAKDKAAAEKDIAAEKAAEKKDKEELKEDVEGLRKKDVAERVAAKGDLKKLEDALKTADLLATLKGKGPFTLFAPDDKAFEKVDLEGLKKDKAKLAGILKMHIVEGKAIAADELAKMKEVVTLGGKVAVSVKDGATMFDGAKVAKEPLEAANGLIYIIDAVVK
jgi:uncharacterized surface protein with fasciclin (FAS1) repeats